MKDPDFSGREGGGSLLNYTQMTYHFPDWIRFIPVKGKFIETSEQKTFIAVVSDCFRPREGEVY